MSIDQKINQILANAIEYRGVPMEARCGYSLGYIESFLATMANRYPEVAKELDSHLAWQERQKANM